MNVTTRAMSASSDSQKLDDLLTKMDTLLKGKNNMLLKLNKLEEIQGTIVKDVISVKQSLQDSQLKIEEKVDRMETAFLKGLIEDLENWTKCNNIVIWAWKKAVRELTPQWKNISGLPYFKV